MLRLLFLLFFFSGGYVFATAENQYEAPNLRYDVSLRSDSGIKVYEACDFLSLHGFDSLHKQNIKGKGAIIAFLEPRVQKFHKQFNSKKIGVIDHSLCSSKEEIFSNFERLGILQVMREEENCAHGNHIVGIALGNPRFISLDRKKEIFYPGGCCPEAQGYVYTYSSFLHSYSKNQNCVGVSILSMKQFEDYSLADELYRCLDLKLTSEEVHYINKRPIDESPLKALVDALNGPAFVINWSSIPYYLMDPRKEPYGIPSSLLEEIATLASAKDKILVFAAGNWGQSFEESEISLFYKQILDHEILSQRVVFAVNLCLSEKEDPNLFGTLELSGHEVYFKLNESSNYPGSLFNNLSLCALGSDILSGWQDNFFSLQSGTSQAAPIISSVLALMKQRFADLSGPEILQNLKNTSLPLGNEKLKYVWPPSALNLEHQEK